MPLILAVEPDPRQASRLAVVLRGRRDTDVVMAKSAETALAAMDGRIPDVLLTSQLLSPQDEQRLADWLKDLGPVAGHVQALTIPILATPEKKVEEQPRGLLSGLRRRAESPGAQGCEPHVFAEHVATYLEQGQVERMEMGSATPEAVASAEVVPEALMPEAVGPAPVEPEPAAPPIEVAAAAEDEGAWLLTQTLKATPAIDEPVAEEVDTAPIVQLTPATSGYELPAEVVEEPPVTALSEPQVLTMPSEVVPLQDLEVVFLPPDVITVRDDGWTEVRYAARHDCDTVIPRAAFAEASAPGPAPLRPDLPASTPVVAASDGPPVMDEWGLFDPSKCGFEALLDKLDEITEDERRAQADVDTHVRVVTHY
jgi:CheY-like chemotaxis protein